MLQRFVVCGFVCLLLSMCESSYWSKRRRIHASVEGHLADIAAKNVQRIGYQSVVMQ